MQHHEQSRAERDNRTIREIAETHEAVNAKLDAIVAAMPPLTPKELARLRVLFQSART